MKKITLTLALALGLANLVSAQDLYVAPNSYVYVQDEVIYVNDDIRMEAANSNIYLRDGSQLVQGTNVKNSDQGELSIYQTPTVGVYEYNYWCSPVGVGANSAAQDNEEFDITNLHQPASLTINETSSATHAITAGYTAGANELSSFWLYQMESGGGYDDWVPVRANPNAVEAGHGFTMKGRVTTDANRVIDFRGRPNTGTITLDCTFSGTDSDPNSGLNNQVETLTGNPYPSAMDLRLFLLNATNNNSLDGSIYFWEQKNVNTHFLASYEGGYAVWTPGGAAMNDPGTYNTVSFVGYNSEGGEIGTTSGASTNYTSTHGRRFASPGQGFMVRSSTSTNGGSVQIDNSMRLYLQQAANPTSTGSQFGRANNEAEEAPIKAMSHNGHDYMDIVNNMLQIPEIRVHTKINDTYYRENVIAFRDGMDLTYNKFGDALHPTLLPTDTYLALDSKKLTIKSFQYQEDARIPFAFIAGEESNTFNVRINSANHVDENITIFLHDKENDTYTDIREGSFDITLEKGDYTDRFEIVFKDFSRELEEELEEELSNADFDVYQNNSIKQLVIKNPKEYNVNSFVLFDAAGKMIYNKVNLGNNTEFQIPTASLSNGVYIAKVTTKENFEITQKFSINN